jgi:hypothetical protein
MFKRLAITELLRRLLFAFLTAMASPSWADVITEWNQIAIEASMAPPNAVLQSRVLAIAHAAIYEAVNAAQSRGKPYAVELKSPAAASVDAAAAAAAHGILVRLSPASQSMLDNRLAATLARIADGQSKTDGIIVGSEAAEKIAALRKGDGADLSVGYKPLVGPGTWQPTPPLFQPAILVQWGSVKPFLLKSAAQYEVKGPPAPGSAQFLKDMEEVRDLGARFSTKRTADETAAAIFWTIQTAIPWNAAARAASQERGLSVFENARLFAILNMACADSQIAGFRVKYLLNHWRPVTAIRAERDAKWEPLLGTPPHPDYPSTHVLMSGAAEAVLKGYFASDSVSVSTTHPPVFGVTRSYESFSQIADEVENARVWGGIHFRSADVDGRQLGRKIGDYALKSFPM